MMIRTIIFDLGGVILTLDQSEAIRRFQQLGISDADRRLDIYTQDGIFGQLEEGKITADTFQREAGLLAGHQLTFEECRWAWLGYAKELPQRNLDLLLKLRSEGYRVVLLSNTNPFMMSWMRSPEFDGQGHSIDYYMDACYLSYEMGVMKPSQEFFHRVLMAEGISPSETLFLDDGARNVAAVSQMGIRTFCPENGADWTKEIYDYLK